MAGRIDRSQNGILIAEIDGSCAAGGIHLPPAFTHCASDPFRGVAEAKDEQS
jgi:hypothetical protein